MQKQNLAKLLFNHQKYELSMPVFILQLTTWDKNYQKNGGTILQSYIMGMHRCVVEQIWVGIRYFSKNFGRHMMFALAPHMW